MVNLKASIIFEKASNILAKTAGLDALMFHNGYKIPAGIKTIAYNMMELANTMVARIDVDEITGKRHSHK